MTTPLDEISGMLEACALGGAIPRVHGNGFVQVDCPWDEDLRINVWGHPDIPKQKVPTPIHDHRFSFHSKIYKGVMSDERMTFLPATMEDGTHSVYHVECREGEDTELVPTNEIMRVSNIFRNTYERGEHYSCDIGTFHESIVSAPTITAIKKRIIRREYKTRVMVPLGCIPDNEFTRDSLTAKRLWGIVYEVLLG